MRKASRLLILIALTVQVTTTSAQGLTTSNQGFKNPVLPGFHADPSVCRAGDDFYLVNSTFQYFPGVPVFHSKDLVNWEQVGNCLTRPSQVDLTATDGNSGIYAPTIRYHEGRFYMVTTVFPSRRHFYVWTDNPEGEWSEPIVIDFAIGSCDPTLFWDEGKCYFLWKEGDIKICEIDVETGKKLGEIHHLGVGLGGRYPEGPHIYKKDGWYYLLLAEGGTEHGHHVNILRSKSLFGPYESNPANPILSHFNMKMQNSPIQGLGHADLIQAPDDSWWMICLGYRTSGYLQHVMGRETMLAPVQWTDGGWPVVNGDGTLQIDMQCLTLPFVQMPQDPMKEEFDYIKRNAPADSYHSLGLPMGWMSLCNPDYSKYSLTERKGYLRLRPSTIDLSETANPTFVARRQTEFNFTATALFDLSHLTEGMQAGITAYAAPLNHYDVVVESRDGNLFVKSNIRLGQTSHSEQEIPLSGNKAYLRITSDKDFYYMQASSDGTNFTTLAKMEYRFLSTETIGGFTGVMLGLFAQSQESTGYVDVDWFEYIPLSAQNDNDGYGMTMNVDMLSQESDISPMLYGVFFEEINHAGEGGLYGELLGNRSFEDKQMPEGYRVEGDRIIPPVHTNYGTGKPSECSFPWPTAEVPDWQLCLDDDAKATMHTTTNEPHFATAPTTLKVEIKKLNKGVLLTNAGFWGMGIRLEAQASYRLRMIVKSNSKKPLLISLEDADGKRIGSASLKLKGNGKWQDEVLTIKAGEACSNARLAIAFPEVGSYDFDYISLFPVDTYKQRENGMRRDVALMIDSLHPKFVRWPGGCVVEGITLNNRFEWKKTLGDPASRPGEYDSWGYRNSYGFGYKEFLDFCEDLGAKAMYVCNVGMACTGRTGEVCKEEEIEVYIQDALDAIEYAIGDSTTVWGAVRCKTGHSQPYPLEYVEIGNENFGPIYERRYNQFYKAIKARYPHLTFISDYGVDGNQTAEYLDMVDPHWYVEPERFFREAYLFDSFDRNKNKYKVYVGEYACNDGVGTGNMLAALSEAAFLTGVERNSDVVRMASYAPLFEHKGDRAWPVNLIWISNKQVVGRSSYYVQKMFANNVADYNLKTDIAIKPEKEHEALTDYDGYISIEPQPAGWQVADDVKYGPGTIVEFKARGNEAYTFYWGKTKQNLEKALALNIGKKSGALSIDRVYWNNAYPYVSHSIDVPLDSIMHQYRIEILRDGIICSIDGREVWHYQTPLVNRHFAVAGYNKTRQEIIIKAVNASDDPCKTHINLTNGKFEFSGSAITLKATSMLDENSYEEPYKIYPSETEINGNSSSYDYKMAPYSVNILRIPAAVNLIKYEKSK